MDEFQFLLPDDVDRPLGKMKATTCLLNLCPFWFIKATRKGLVEWVGGLGNASLQQSRIPACLMEALVKPLFKKLFLHPTILNDYWLSLIFHSWARCRSRLWLLGSRGSGMRHYLDLFQSSSGLVMWQMLIWLPLCMTYDRK